jgi:hypothetical protein
LFIDIVSKPTSDSKLIATVLMIICPKTIVYRKTSWFLLSFS